MYNVFRTKSRTKTAIHRAVALMLSLGLALNIILQLDLTIPVIVAKADNEETLYFNSVQTTIPGSPQVAITNYDYTITAKGETYDKTSATPIIITASPDTSIDLSLLMHYVFNDESTVTSIKNNGGYIYYQLPANLSFDQNYFGSNSKVKDTQYANAKWGGADVPSGYYSIWNGDNGDGTKSNPLLVIHFTPDYVNYFSANKYLEGNIEFEGKVKRDETIEGDQTLSFANGPTITVDFAKDKVTAQKNNAESKKDDSGNPYLEWKVTVKNPGGRTDLTNYALSDELNGAAFALNAENCTVEPSGDGSFENGTYVFSGKGEGQYQETYTFTYKQSNPTPGLQYNNEVTLTGGDEDVTSEATGKIEDKLEVSKSGKADYQDSGDRDDTINWEITVENKSGNSLADDQAYLVDAAFGNYKTGTLSVVDANGDPMTEGTDYQVISGKVFYNDNNNLTDVTNASTSIDPSKGVPQIYVDENGNYVKINTIVENALVGKKDGVLYNTNGQITNFHYDENGVLHNNGDGPIDFSRYTLVDGKYYDVYTQWYQHEIPSYHKEKNTENYYFDSVINSAYCWIGDVPYYQNGVHTASYKVLEIDGKIYDIETYHIENLTANNKIISGSILKFIGENDTPKATVTYSTEVTGLDHASLSSVSQSNTVYTGSDASSPPTNTNSSATVEYKNELALVKKAADDGFDEESETFKWKLKLYANASSRSGDQVAVDANSLETIDDYTIEDAMFKNVTVEELNSNFNCIMNDGNETTEYCKYVTITKETDTKIKFKINTALMKQDQKTGVISGIELFYNTSAANTLDNTVVGDDGLTEYQRYQNHTAVPKRNDATAYDDDNSYSSHDGVGITAQTRYSATKTFTGNKETIIEQDVSQNTKALDWKIALIKDHGFNQNSVVLVDSLGSSTTQDGTSVDTDGKVLHYLTQTQLDAIVLKGRTTELGSETTIDSNLYEVTPTTTEITDGETTTSYITGFRIRFKAGIDTANYRYIDVTYQTTASLEDVEAGWKTVFTNGCDFGNHSDDTGITYEHEDINKSKPTTLRLNKTWVDSNNVFQTRPDEIQVKVLQATEGSDDWHYIMDLETEEAKIYTLPVNGNMIIGDDFPQWKTVTNNGVTTTVRYQYKVEEILEEGSVYTAGSVNPVTATGDNTNLNLTNTLTETIYNKLPDQGSMTSSQITKVTVKEIGVGNVETDVEYYVFKWKVNMNLTQNTSSNTIRTFVDTMPNGFVYVTDTMADSLIGNNNSKPLYNDKTNYHYKDGTNASASQFSEEYHTGESVTTSGSTITFKVRENIEYIEYYTMIPVDEFERALTNGAITNKIRLQEKGETDHPAVVTITDIPPTDNENVKKMYKGGSQGTLRYALDFNPQGKKLSNSKYVDITDTLKYETESADTLDNLKFSLTNLKVYEYQADGSYTELSKSDYRSSVSYSNVTDVQSLPVTSGGDNKTWTVAGWQPGQTLTIAFSGADQYYSQLKVEEKDASNNWIGGNYFNGSNGSGNYSFTVNANTASITITQTDGKSATPSVSVKTSVDLPEGTLKNTPAVLHIEVPDQKYLRIEYTYTVTGYTEAPEGSNNQTNVIVSNTASFATDNAAGYDNSDHNAMNVDHSSATSNTKTHPEIYKVDANSLSIDDLAAQFVILKYDVENHTWIYADSIAAKSGDGVPTREITFGTDVLGSTIDTSKPTLEFTASPTDGSTAPITANHKFTLEPNAIYRFIEIAAPEGYRQPPASGNVADYDEFTFYYAYALEGDVPDDLNGISSRIYTVVQDGRFDIPNSKYVSISAKKEFSGKTSEVPDSATVNLQLYWSYNRDGTDLNTFGSGFPIQSEYSAAFNATKDLSYTKNGTNTVTWQGLPDAYYGKPVYYYVKEQSYTYEKEGITYSANANNVFSDGVFKPIYVNNGINADGDTITINNASGLVIRKEWLNSSGNTINPPKEVDADVGSTENSISVGFTLTAVVIASDETVTLNIPVTLNSNNSYEYAIEAGGQVVDTDGNEYYLSDLKNFAISEALTATQQSEIGDDYVFSPAYEMSNHMGVIKLINTSTLPNKTSVTAEKHWIGTSRAVDVELYQTKTPNLTETQIAALTAGEGITKLDEQTLNSGNSFTYTWGDLDNADSNGTRYYYYVKEKSSFTGVSTLYEVTVTHTEQKTVITNTEETNLVVTKAWGSTPNAYQNDVVVQLWVSDDGNSWTNTGRTLTLTSPDWSGRFGSLDKTKHYKVVESAVNGSAAGVNAFTVSYDSENAAFGENENSKTITVTNTLKTGSIKLKKIWQLGGQNPALPSSITVALTDSKGTQSVKNLVLSAATQIGDTYEWTIGDLPLYAPDGTQLTYTAAETAISGFEVSYGNNSGITPDQWNPGTITVTNTWTEFNLAIKKDWSDSDTNDHAGDVITVVLHRSIDPSNAPEKDLIDDGGGGDEPQTPIHREVTYDVIDGDFSDGSSGWQSYNIPSDFDGKALSNISTYFRDTLSNYPDYRTHSNIYVTGVEDVCAYSTDGRIAIRSYTDNPTGAVAAGWKTAHASEIEKFVVNFTDGSTFTINNSNYIATAPTIVTETATLAMATDQWQSVNIPSSLQSKEVSKLEAVFKDTLSSFPDYQTDSNFGLKINGADITSNVVQSVNGKSAIKIYPSNTLADEVAVWSKNPEDIEKFIVTYTDGSTLTITNSNYDSGGGGGGETPSNETTRTLPITNYTLGDPIDISQYFYVSGDDSLVPESITINYADGTECHVIVAIKGDWATDGNATSNGILFNNNANYYSTGNGTQISVSKDSNGSANWYTLSSLSNAELQISDWYGTSSLNITSVMFNYGTAPTASPRPAYIAPPTQPETTSSTPVSSPLTAQHVYRVGKLTRAEEIIEENEDIETISQAVSVLLKPRVILLASSSSDWVSETNGQAKTITFSATDSWQWTDSLPMYDASGNKYYYWVEETAITGNSTLTAFDVAYKFDDGTDSTTYCIDAVLHGNSEITIRNTPKESQAGVLPESGSTGTRIYYIAGGMLLLLAAAGYWAYSIKRRRWYDE